jgi:hypothetical protein
VTTRVLASLCALGVCGALLWVARQDALRFSGAHAQNMALTLALIAAITAPLPWLGHERRSTLVLSGSILIGAVLMRWLIVVPLLFACFTLWVSRTSWPTWQKLTLLLGIWTAAAVGKWMIPRGHFGLILGVLSMYWSCLPAAIICLVVERGRGQLESATPVQEGTYLLALPRFFLPFLQPIGARRFIESRRQFFTWQLALSALGLCLYSGLLRLAIKDRRYLFPPSQADFWQFDHVPRLLNDALYIYGVNAAQLFAAVALLRLLGYGLGSGFRYPLLSSSFADVFRRWNYYYFEFVTGIFLIPLVSRLQRRMPLWLAYVLAGYPSILLGVWALDNIAFQIAIGRNATPLLNELREWNQLAGYIALWSLIIFPQLVLARLRRFRKHLWWRIGAHALTLAVGFGALIAAYYLRVVLI